MRGIVAALMSRVFMVRVIKMAQRLYERHGWPTNSDDARSPSAG